MNDRLVNVVQLERGTSMRLSKVSMMRFYLVPVVCCSSDAFRSLVYDVSPVEVTRRVVYLTWIDVHRNNPNRRVPFEAVLISHQLTTVFFLNNQHDADRHRAIASGLVR